MCQQPQRPCRGTQGCAGAWALPDSLGRHALQTIDITQETSLKAEEVTQL